MRKIFQELPLRRILLVSVILGSLIGAFNVFAQDIEIEGLTCRTTASGCTIEGCHNPKPDGSGYTVCLYSGTNCPPLNQCVP